MSQVPMHEEIVSTPTRIRWMGHGLRVDGADRLWKIEGAIIRFRHVRFDEMFGITSVRLDSETVVPMFDRERALLEGLMRRSPGGVPWASELVRDQPAVFDRSRLRGYAARLGVEEVLADVLPRSGRRERVPTPL
jgi:hypothetical protein